LRKGKRKKNNQKIEKRELEFHLWLRPSLKEDYTRIFDVLTDTHAHTYKAIYGRLITSTNEVANEFKEEAICGKNNSIPQYTDYGDYMEAVQDYVFERIDEQFLMHYQFELMSLSNLYQVFEQQLRKWLYEEMTHNENQYINQIKIFLENDKGEDVYHEFYSNFKKLTDVLAELKLTFTDLFGNEELIIESEFWKTIRECYLLSNTYKHGSGKSATNLYNLYPQYFEKVNATRLMDLYRTTNLERVLVVDKITFEKYSNAMKGFWENMKEHQYGKLRIDIDVSSEKD